MTLKDLEQELKEIIKDYKNPKEGPCGSYWTSKIGKRLLFFQELGIIVLTDEGTRIDGLKLIEYIKADIVKTCKELKDKEGLPDKYWDVGCITLKDTRKEETHNKTINQINALMNWSGVTEADLK